jgi:hypothetical protein
MPRHLKKVAAKPTSGMPQTRQFGAIGVLISKGALISTQQLERRDQLDDFICRRYGSGDQLHALRYDIPACVFTKTYVIRSAAG